MSEKKFIYAVYGGYRERKGAQLYSAEVVKITARRVRFILPEDGYENYENRAAFNWRHAERPDRCDFTEADAWRRFLKQRESDLDKFTAAIASLTADIQTAREELAKLEAK